MLTLQKLRDLPKGIFADGTIEDSPSGINMENTGRMLRWVAVRGTIHDWSIYCAFAERTTQEVHDYGDKARGKENIKRLVPCDKEALNMYRY